ncbi:MAG: heparinase II/III-family protein [Opitutaceae bacterium]|nr:heparinase II/III-family protein [Opitutaceae bacterium]
MNTKTLPFLPPVRILDQLGGSATLPGEVATLRDRLVAAAREDAACQPITRRHRSLAELRADPSIRMKYREQPAHMAHLDASGWERFALSLGDCEAVRPLAERRLPRLAAAVRLTRDPALADYLCRQLAELATWDPLVRPGWSGAPHPDGAWLGTGWAVRAITGSLALLPPEFVPDDLAGRIAERLRAEIAGVRNDWRTRPNWFTQQEAVHSNQWVLPNEAVILASLHLGLDRHRDDYEFGVRNVLRSLDAQGPCGEFVEGLEYGSITLASALSAARAAVLVAGDTRLLDHPFFRKFPVWYLHHLQPAGFTINAFDARVVQIDRGLVATLAATTGDPAAFWYLRTSPATEAVATARDHAGVQATPCDSSVILPELLAACAARVACAGAGRELTDPSAPVLPVLPLCASYPVATRVNWIENWGADDGITGGRPDKVSGFWMRGGHATDTHDHQDRGHVNFIVKGRPVLIEAGLFSYGIPEHTTHFKSVAGHNVLQVGGHAPAELAPQVLAGGAGQILDAAHRSAPLTVNRLDAAGGDVTMDGSACYAGVRRWSRRVGWDAVAVTVCDEVELPAPDTLLFRWHLGLPAGAPRAFAPGKVCAGDIVVSWEADVPLTASIEAMPDNTLTPGTLRHHATLVLRTGSPVTYLKLTTHISLSVQP